MSDLMSDMLYLACRLRPKKTSRDDYDKLIKHIGHSEHIGYSELTYQIPGSAQR
jgi:hypothetical protein